MDGKDVILYLYDLQTYINDRDFNYPFQKNVVGKEIYNFPDLLACLSLNDYKIDETKRHEIINKFWGEKSQPKNVCKEIIIKTTNPS
jgi:CDP-glycerol glycerophosphotransferase (TagB/SpsB family)